MSEFGNSMFENGLDGRELASLIALRRLMEQDRNLLNIERVVASLTGRAAHLAKAIIGESVLLSEADTAALEAITSVAVVRG